MGAPKQKWTSEEEEALRAGVLKHGTGKWKNIQKDPEFHDCLANRSNIDLKDKWRNMSVSASGQGSREKCKTPKLKALLPSPLSNSATASPIPLSVQYPSSNPDAIMDSSKSPVDGKNAPRYNSMIIEALGSMKDPNGSDVSSILGFIEQKHDVPPNFKRALGSKLRRLLNQNKIAKVQNGYKLLNDGASLGKKATSVQKEQNPSQVQTSGVKTLLSEIEEAAKTAAYMIADAENKTFMAAEAVKEAERVATMAENSASVLQLVKEIFEKCSRGDTWLMA